MANHFCCCFVFQQYFNLCHFFGDVRGMYPYAHREEFKIFLIIYALFSSHSMRKCFFLFSVLFTSTVLFLKCNFSHTLLKDVTFFGLIPGLLWWVIKCFFHLLRLLCLWINYLSSAAKFRNSVSQSVQCSSSQEEFYLFFPLFLWPSACSQIMEMVLDFFAM